MCLASGQKMPEPRENSLLLVGTFPSFYTMGLFLIGSLNRAFHDNGAHLVGSIDFLPSPAHLAAFEMHTVNPWLSQKTVLC